MHSTKVNLCIFASGNGSNALNLIEHAVHYPHVCIKALVCDNPEAPILKKMKSHAISTYLISYQGDKEKHEQEILNLIQKLNIHWILLAGYMRILSKNFIKSFSLDNHRSRIINIHPSLLPAFKGKNAYEQAFNSGVDKAGVTIHFVDCGIDTGEIIIQEEFPRHTSDSLEDFKKRGLALEHTIYPSILSMLSPDTIYLTRNLTNA